MLLSLHKTFYIIDYKVNKFLVEMGQHASFHRGDLETQISNDF